MSNRKTLLLLIYLYVFKTQSLIFNKKSIWYERVVKEYYLMYNFIFIFFYIRKYKI